MLEGETTVAVLTSEHDVRYEFNAPKVETEPRPISVSSALLLIDACKISRNAERILTIEFAAFRSSTTSRA